MEETREVEEAKLAGCPTPDYHVTRTYCPSCPDATITTINTYRRESGGVGIATYTNGFLGEEPLGHLHTFRVTPEGDLVRLS